MGRLVSLFTGQWADLPLEEMARKTKEFGYDGIELACWGDHFEVDKALSDPTYCSRKKDVLARHDLQCQAISAHLVGQAILDPIDERHKAIVPPYVWGDGNPAGVTQRAIEELKNSARAAQKLGVGVVNGFTGSSIWHLNYSFPPVHPKMIDCGFQQLAERFNPMLDAIAECGSPWKSIRRKSPLTFTPPNGRSKPLAIARNSVSTSILAICIGKGSTRLSSFAHSRTTFTLSTLRTRSRPDWPQRDFGKSFELRRSAPRLGFS
jgi:hypothetical protein